MKRQTMAHLAKDMDAWIEKRDLLSSKIDELKRQKRTASKSKVHMSTVCRHQNSSTLHCKEVVHQVWHLPY